ncbi:MAG TPA: HNH endonuclease signature motif containing protein [Streptosporangiaceae bacterium]
MFDKQQPGQGPDSTIQDRGAGPAVTTPDPEPPEQVPLERLESQMCELAGHLAAATCRFLLLLADFDARNGWASWDMRSCTQWLSWKCQMSMGTAREHVRVARALGALPVITAEFAAGRLSYSKVRALTRIADVQTDAALAELALPMTASQLDRFARAHRQVSDAEEGRSTALRRLAWRIEDDGTLAGTFRLPPLAGQVLLKALRAATGDLEHPHDEHGGATGDAPAGTPGPQADAGPGPADSGSLADALVAVAEAFLAGKIATADNQDVYQVIVHASADMLPSAAEVHQMSERAAALSGELLPGTADEPPQGTGNAPAGTSAAGARPCAPAGPGRCHVEDGPAIGVTTMQMLTCEATLSWMTHDQDGNVLNVGRRRRRPTAAIRRAARERDNGRCRFPGCDSRRVDLHHIQYWSRGGQTRLDNLISLCKAHHRLVHTRGYLITAADGATFTFRSPQGTPIPPCPTLPGPRGEIAACHDADITMQTIVPAWYGERLNLDYAIGTCLANAERARERAHAQAAETMAAAA